MMISIGSVAQTPDNIKPAERQYTQNANATLFNCGFTLRKKVEYSTATHTPVDAGHVFADSIRFLAKSGDKYHYSAGVMAYAKIGLGAYYIGMGMTDTIDHGDLYDMLYAARNIDIMLDFSYCYCCLEVLQYCNQESLFKSEADLCGCYVRACEKVFGENSEMHYESLQQLANALSTIGDNAGADSCLAFCQEYLENADSTHTDAYREIIVKRIDERDGFADTKTTEELCDKLVALSSTNQHDETEALLRRAKFNYSTLNDYVKAGNDIKRIISLMSLPGNYSPEVTLNLFGMIENASDDKQAKDLLAIVRKNYHEGDFVSTVLMSRTCLLCGDYADADRYYKNALSIARFKDDGTAPGIDDEDMEYLVNLFEARCEYDELEKWLKWKIEEMLETKESFNLYRPFYNPLMSLLLNMNSFRGYYKTSNQILRDRLKDKSLTPRERKTFMQSLEANEAQSGNFHEAYIIGKKVKSSFRLTPAEYHLTQQGIISALVSEIDLRKTNYQDMRQGGADSLIAMLADEVRELNDTVAVLYGKESPNYIDALISAITVSFLQNDIPRTMTLLEECEKAILLLPNSNNRTFFLNNLASIYLEIKDYSKALKLIRGNMSQPFSPMAWFDKAVEAEALVNLGKTKDAQAAYIEAANAMVSNVLKNFTTLNEEERTNFWRMYSQWLYNSGKFIEKNEEESEFTATVFNIALFSKGLLLHSNREIQRIINRSGDADLQQDYKRLGNIRSTLNNAASLSDNEKKALENQAKVCEDSIMRRCLELGNYMRRLTAKGKDIQKTLNDSDAAIEFITYNINDTTRQYAALVLRKNSKYPRFYRLFNEDDVERSASGKMISDKYTQLVWKPVMKSLKGIRNIYFSPAGLLNKIPIEYLPLDSTDMSSAYNMHRLSSTRELLDGQADDSIEEAVVYGGLEYDADIETRRDGNDEAKRVFHFQYLPGTEEEALDIAGIAKTDSIACTTKLGEDGTEKSFKALSGKPIQLLHVGTHGFCRSLNTRLLDNLPLFMHRNNLKVEDRSMFYSGLAMTGINNASLADETTMGNDGYLSAKEISTLDLHNVALAVLSACNTNDGDVTGDGTFGLQRGFKLSGIKSLLMTAWSVDDKATRLFMHHFYTSLLAGGKPVEALRYAQQRLRAAENGKYDKPDYWASFILLDAN